MIVFKPTLGIVQDTELDFELLSFIFTKVFNAKERVELKVEKSRNRNSFSGYYHGSKLIRIFVHENATLRYFISTLLHEVRHHYQFEIFGDKINTLHESYRSYYNSAEEVDARKMEKITGDVCKLYRTYKSIEKKKEELGIDSFKELGYNLGVRTN